MESAGSFNKAVKHLFRHLHEPQALHGNPLIARLFELGVLDEACRNRDRTMLDRVQQLVFRAANECRDADLAAGRDELAARRYTIVTQQCLSRQPIDQVATELGLSVAQCYRERAEICQRVARYMLESRAVAASPSQLDEFAVLRARVVYRAAHDRTESRAEIEHLVREAPSPEQKIDSLRLGALVLLQFGDFDQAVEAHEAAKRIYRDNLAGVSSPRQRFAKACLDFFDSKLAEQHADNGVALRMARHAVSEVEPLIGLNAPPYARELYVQSLFELAAALSNAGDLNHGCDRIAEAERQSRALPSAPAQLRTGIAITLWRLRNRLLTASPNYCTVAMRCDALTEAFEQAYQSGLFSQASAALTALAECHALAGNDLAALRSAKSAVLLANQVPGDRVRAQTSIQVADILMATRYWRDASAFLPPTSLLEACDANHRKLFSYITAERASRLHRFQEVLNWANNQDHASEYAALTFARQLLAAKAAHALGLRRQATALVDATVPAVEQYGSAALLREAYGIAATVTRDPRFQRQARSLTELLSN
jgi:tetratricopeptide (TPR) repeat protein